MDSVADERDGPVKRKNLRVEVARELFDALPQIEDDMKARPAEQDSIPFVEELAHSPTPEEAITFCAYVLPRRFAVWWGHECLRSRAALLTAADEELLELAAAWVANPDEDSRYAALDRAMDGSPMTCGSWIAVAAGWSGGSMVGPDLPPVPPAPHMTARAVNAGILTLLAQIEVAERVDTLRRFVRMAVMLTEDA